jgi:hypothetical protein
MNYLADPIISAMDSFTFLQRFNGNSVQPSEMYLGHMNCFHILAVLFTMQHRKDFQISVIFIRLPGRKYHDKRLQ